MSVNWFEIPATHFERAVTFYTAVFAAQLEQAICPVTGEPFAIFPDHSGCVIASSGLQPGMTGSRIYLDAGEHLEALLARVPIAGGKVVLPLTAIGEGKGDMALIEDTEGNQIGLHRQ